MRFEVDFNRGTNDKVLEKIGCVLTPTGATKYPPFEIYTIELDNFSDLDELLVYNVLGEVVSYNSNVDQIQLPNTKQIYIIVANVKGTFHSFKISKHE